MSLSMTLEEKFEALMKSYPTVTAIKEEMRDQNAYLRKQLEQSMKQKQKALESLSSSNLEDESEGAESQHMKFEAEVEPRRSPQRECCVPPSNSNDFRVDIPDFEGKLDPEKFLNWLSTVERVFDYKAVPEDKKVKLVALKL